MTAGHSDKASDHMVQGYCVHCRARRIMRDAIQVCNKRGGRDLKGICSVCGRPMYRLGGWETVGSSPTPASPEAIMEMNGIDGEE